MKRNSDIAKRFPGLYNHLVLDEIRKSEGISLRGVALELGMNDRTVRRVFRGRAHQKQAWPVANRFNVDWSKLHDLTISPDNHRAVLITSSRTVR